MMARIFVDHLSRRGHDVSLVTSNPLLAEQVGAAPVPDLRRWHGKTVVIGGGAMLSNSHRIRRYVSSASRTVEREFSDLCRFVERTPGARVVPISIGSDGIARPLIDGSRRQLFSSAAAPHGTVRLHDDVALMKSKFSKTYEYVPDILFSVRSARGIRTEEALSAPSDRPFRIGVNLNRRHAGEALAAVRRSIPNNSEIVSLITHSDHFRATYEWAPLGSQTVRYQRLDDFVNELAKLDLLISDKLHVGMTAAGLGVPFISFKGRGKTVALHRELDLAALAVDSGARLGPLVDALSHGGRVRSLRDAITTEGLDAQASRHLELLDEYVAD